MGTYGARAPMSIFEHYVADCSIAHQKAMRAQREKTEREASAQTVDLFHRLHRLADLVDELGADAVFKPPPRPMAPEEVRRLFPL